MGPTHESISNDFSYHPGDPISVERHEAVRVKCREVAHYFLDEIPEGPARTTAINKLREAMMWANAAIACDTPVV